jgi:hypothetical protein
MDEQLMTILLRICHFLVRTILLMATSPSFMCYVMTYNKDEQNIWKLIGNLGKFVDINRCINLYIGKLYCV